jgi:hypothetical protein
MTSQPTSGYKFIIIDKHTGKIIKKLNRADVPARDFIKKKHINLKEEDVIIFEDEEVDKLDIPNNLNCNNMIYDFKDDKVIDNRPDIYIYKFKNVINVGDNTFNLNNKIIKTKRELSDEEIKLLEDETNTNRCVVYKSKQKENFIGNWKKIKEVKKDKKI